MKDGIFRLYHVDHSPEGESGRRLVARFAIHDGQVVHMEDHLHNLQSMLPEGEADERIERQMQRMGHSAYYHLVNEDDIDAGEHPHEVEEVQHGVNGPEAVYQMVVPGAPKPFKLEVTGRVVTVDGKRLADKDAEGLLQQIANGQIQLQPVQVAEPMQKSEDDGMYYHGTPHNFGRFEQRLGVGGLGGPFHNPDNPAMTQRTGFFFTKNPRVAEGYAGDTGRVVQADLNMTNPYDFAHPDSFYNDELNGAFDRQGLPPGFLRKFSPRGAFKWPTWQMFDGENGPKVVQALNSLGHDGASFHEETPDQQDTDITYVVFSPQQIRQRNSNGMV